MSRVGHHSISTTAIAKPSITSLSGTTNNGTGSTVKRILLDVNEQPEKCVPLIDDRNDHNAEVEVS